jgi:Schwannomin-interacting protein 1
MSEGNNHIIKHLNMRYKHVSFNADEECSSDSDTCPNLKNFTQTTMAKPRSLTSKMDFDIEMNDEMSDEETSKVFTNLARLQIEARMALSQSKNMAQMQVEVMKITLQCNITLKLF